MKGIESTVTRQLKITTSKVIPLATETIMKNRSLIRSKKGFLELKSITKDLKKFLEENDMTIEQSPVESRRGRVEIAGVKVKVIPVMHTHYDGGVFIQIAETGAMSYENTNKVLAHFVKHGIDVNKECVFIKENSEEGACLFKSTK